MKKDDAPALTKISPTGKKLDHGRVNKPFPIGRETMPLKFQGGERGEPCSMRGKLLLLGENDDSPKFVVISGSDRTIGSLKKKGLYQKLQGLAWIVEVRREKKKQRMNGKRYKNLRREASLVRRSFAGEANHRGGPKRERRKKKSARENFIRGGPVFDCKGIIFFPPGECVFEKRNHLKTERGDEKRVRGDDKGGGGKSPV